MRNMMITAFLVAALIGSVGYAGFMLMNAFNPQKIQSINDIDTALSSGSYTVLSNGTVVYESKDPRLGDIAPAAGGDAAAPANQNSFKYDPLTQTYRRVNSDGQQDIITNAPR